MVEIYKNKKTGQIRFKKAEVIEKDGPGRSSEDAERELSEMDEV